METDILYVKDTTVGSTVLLGILLSDRVKLKSLLSEIS